MHLVARRCLPAMVLLLGLVACRAGDAAPRGSAPAAHLAPLALHAGERSFVPRISSGSRYRRCVEPRAAGASPQCGAAGQPHVEVLDAAARASRAIRDSASPEAFHVSALVDLAWGSSADGRAAGRAVDALVRSAQSQAPSASLLADLAAAQLVRAERADEPLLLIAALDAAARATAIDPRSEVAVFNLAITEERLGLDDQADSAWTAYLRIDAASPWAGEARARQVALRTRRLALPPASPLDGASARTLVADDPGLAREHGLRDDLGTWGTAHLSRDAAVARRALESARALGEQLRVAQRDMSLAEQVRAIDGCQLDARVCDRLARAHVAFAAAHEHVAATQFAAAAASFDSSVTLAGNTPLADWARVHRAAALVYAGDAQQGIRLLNAIAHHADGARYPALVGRAHWSLATTHFRRGEDSAGTVAANSALTLLRQSGENQSRGAVLANLVEVEANAGDENRSARTLMEGVDALRRVRASVWLHNLLYQMARTAQANGWLAAESIIREEDATVSIATGRPVYEAEARIERARSRAANANTAGAADDVAAASRIVAGFSPGARRWFGSLIAIASERAGISQTIAPLDSAVSFFAPINTVLLTDALVARADARLRTDLAGSERDLDSAVSVLRRAAGERKASAARAALFRATRPVFARAVLAHLAAGDVMNALRDAERGRASQSRSATPSVRAPHGAQALTFFVAGDTLISWLVQERGVRVARTRIGAAELRRLSERVTSMLETGGDASAGLAQLYDLLIRPLGSRIVRDLQLVVVADEAIDGVPFAALLDTATRRYLIQDVIVRHARSLADAEEAVAPASEGFSLFIADPAFDTRVHPEFARLKGALAEVEGSQRFYRNAQTLAGGAATVERVLALLPKARVVHVAGHAIHDGGRPERSRLLLAATKDGPSNLTAETIAGLRLPATRLVVLSACETVRSSANRSSSVSNLADAWLAAGARGVVGTLWRVGDSPTAAAMQAFHEQYARSSNAAESLRAMQLRMLTSNDATLRSPASWGAFRYSSN